MAAVAGTLIVDEEGVYDPNHYNDRLLLGLKGTLSEAELHFLKSRMMGGRRNKARRAAFRIRLPARIPSPEGGSGSQARIGATSPKSSSKRTGHS